MGETLEMRVAYSEKTPIAAILTLRFKNKVYYKYGCSDALFRNYGATPWLFWKAITAAKLKGATNFDLGRTERDNAGLLTFKNHWAPNPKPLIYWRYPGSPMRHSATNRKWNLAKSVFVHIPIRLQSKIGEFLYPHVG
jgi:lipid II:glycine glycyltransferase (peptidoglycan interpeptide bridge formation enzyme)